MSRQNRHSQDFARKAPCLQLKPHMIQVEIQRLNNSVMIENATVNSYIHQDSFYELLPLSETQESGGIYVFMLSCYVLGEALAISVQLNIRF